MSDGRCKLICICDNCGEPNLFDITEKEICLANDRLRAERDALAKKLEQAKEALRQLKGHFDTSNVYRDQLCDALQQLEEK